MPESQAGLRKGKGTRDNIYVLRAINDAVLKAGEEIVVSFIDFTAAFDSVSHKFLDEALAEAGAAPKSRALFRVMYTAAEGRVRVRGADGVHISRTFPVNRGVHVLQGDIVSPLCFIIAKISRFDSKVGLICDGM